MQSIETSISHGKRGNRGRKSGNPYGNQNKISPETHFALYRGMIHEDLTYKIRGAIYSVFKELGPGLLEKVYERALMLELKTLGLKVSAQLPILTFYKSEELGLGFKLDLLVENEVVIEIKSVDQLHDVHKKQLLTYLKLTGKKVGLLVNFNSAHIKDHISLVRIVN